MSVFDDLGVTRNGDMPCPNKSASKVVPELDPSPHMMRDLDFLALSRLSMVRFILRPAPVSTMISSCPWIWRAGSS